MIIVVIVMICSNDSNTNGDNNSNIHTSHKSACVSECYNFCSCPGFGLDPHYGGTRHEAVV